MAYTSFEIGTIMKWTNKELERKVENKKVKGSYITPYGDSLTNGKLAKLCERELRRRQLVGLYIKEDGEWDNLTPSEVGETISDLTTKSWRRT